MCAHDTRAEDVDAFAAAIRAALRMTGISLDRLDAAVEVVALDGLEIGGARVREPHRHDYHELIWVREGEGEHRIDGAPVRSSRAR